LSQEDISSPGHEVRTRLSQEDISSPRHEVRTRLSQEDISSPGHEVRTRLSQEDISSPGHEVRTRLSQDADVVVLVVVAASMKDFSSNVILVLGAYLLRAAFTTLTNLFCSANTTSPAFDFFEDSLLLLSAVATTRSANVAELVLTQICLNILKMNEMWFY
jgi:hypothetical protein